MATLSQSQVNLENDPCQQGGNDQSNSLQQSDAPNLHIAIPKSTDGDGLMDSLGSDSDLASLEEIPDSTDRNVLMDILGSDPEFASLEEIPNSMDDDELMDILGFDPDLASLPEIPSSTDADGLMDILGSDSDIESLEAEVRAFDAVVKDFLQTRHGS
ncbi:unnamed protein product [Clonostachys solani]|uniref:Uncharacterized protein n=1 Tax=Clonostachys solani TaxID=160281 RepID=A0A9N9Z240_9HYPO|nr:unnamed protein product [Clonostachys solani]